MLYLKLRRERRARPVRLNRKPLNAHTIRAATGPRDWRRPSICRGGVVRIGKAESRRRAGFGGALPTPVLAEPRAKRAPIGRRSEGAATRAGIQLFPALAPRPFLSSGARNA